MPHSVHNQGSHYSIATATNGGRRDGSNSYSIEQWRQDQNTRASFYVTGTSFSGSHERDARENVSAFDQAWSHSARRR
ncbi:hypothetical protein D7B24_004496 [Verticillium nonalfalfae]|uniref:Uncharacterized protein n=1 Tax=Verticillium nonalfalfae TaxID=1051616 RepID=A0A3M9YEP9_9PEZI|nr:uncharacterized protein D7B24_004496 [Verticillium nonalfalfae]RNJ58625.1 hypothetical protein D7B24_004496 [Verticillium nonalfalfae]